jgi:hypothetical protein
MKKESLLYLHWRGVIRECIFIHRLDMGRCFVSFDSYEYHDILSFFFNLQLIVFSCLNSAIFGCQIGSGKYSAPLSLCGS